MIKNYLITAGRNLFRTRTYSLLNIAGLAIGIICCIIVFLYVFNEYNFDKHHSGAENIFRVKYRLTLNDVVYNEASVPFPLAETISNEFPGIKKTLRLYKNPDAALIRVNHQKYKEENFFFADSSLFDVFDFKVLKGNAVNAFKDPSSVILTRSTAEKYFGDVNTIGRTLEYENKYNLKVTAVIEDLPSNSHFSFDLAAPLALQMNIWKEQTGTEGREYKWFWTGAWTYILLDNPAEAAEINSGFPGFAEKYFPERIRSGVELELQPLTDIHLHSDLDNEIKPNGSVVYVYAFTAVAFFVLLIACMNFVNLSTAYSLSRNKEYGIRKVLGASRFQLIIQTLTETIISILLSVFISISTLELILPYFNDLTGLALNLRIINLLTWTVFFLILITAVSVLAGIYPALFVIKINSLSAFKGHNSSGFGKEFIRKALVVMQFSISVLLLIFIGIVNQQLHYFQDKNLGFNKNNLLFIKARPEVTSKLETFKENLLKHSEIKSVSAGSDVPGDGVNASRFIPEGFTAENPLMLPIMIVDDDFINTLSVRMQHGRSFSENHPSDSSEAFILNETAARQLGWNGNAIGKTFALFAPGTTEISKSGTVIGVTEDYHFESLHHEVKPLVLTIGDFLRFYIVKYQSSDIQNVLSKIENEWKQFSPEWQMEYFFLDQNLDNKYQEEQNMRRLINYFTALAILIACLGLFGLNSFTTRQRTKEVGIRKVLGASVWNILSIFAKEILKLLVVANLCAWPVAYLVGNRWLEDYAYRTDINLSPFLMAALITIIIALFTVCFQVIKAAAANPVNSLKYE